MFQYTLFILIAPFAAAGTIALAFYTRRAKQTPGANSLFWCFSAIAGFLIVSTFELLFNIFELKIFFARLDLLFFAILSVTWLAFSLDYTGKNHLLSPRFFWIVLLIPISTAILTLTGDHHKLIWQSVSVIDTANFSQLQMQYGIWFWVHLVYSYALIIIGSSLIAKEYFALHNVYRKQSIWMVVGATLPLFVNLVCVFSLIPGLHKDFSPIGFALGGIGFAIGIFKYQLLDIVPIARSTLIDKMKDGVIVLNLREQVVDINPAAQVILGLSSQHIIGKPINTFFSSWPAYFNPSSLTTDHQEVELYRNGELQHFEVRITELSSRSSQVIGLLLTLHDITERKVLLEKVRKLAQLDTVTGLFNRRHFISLAVKELARTITEGLPCSLILVDLDYF